jgi:hypothetical protein
MEDFAAALKDLEAYLRLMPRGEAPTPEQEIETSSVRMGTNNRCPNPHRSGST